jgi:hypothetical protein
MRLERQILRFWREFALGAQFGTRIEHHMIRYLCHLVPSLVADPWFQAKIWSFYDTRSRGRSVTNWFGSQNCLAPETLVRMFDGRVCRADQVEVGDLLMGPDSTPRRVLNTCEGVAPMYEVSPKVGSPFRCTGNHPVTVVTKRISGRNPPRGGSPVLHEIEAATLSTFPNWKMDNYGLKSAQVEYPHQNVPIDPYIYGLWLGDGDTNGPTLTNVDHEVVEAWCSYFTERGYSVKALKHPERACRYGVSWPHRSKHNPMCDFVRSSVNLNGSKFIRSDYLLGSVKQRLELLAGLIDTDGYLANTFYEISSSRPSLADGIQTLAESLGFRVSRKKKETNFKGCPTEKINICGDIWSIPVRIKRKIKKPPTPGRGVRKHGVTGFTVSPVGVGQYVGFEVDGDHRFLLADYTITHNSGKTMGMATMAVGFGCLHPEYTRQTASGPFKDAGESPLWSAMQEVFEEVRLEWGEKLAEWTGAIYNKKTNKWESNVKLTSCIMRPVASKKEMYFSESPKAGTIKLVAMDEVGKVQGAKSKDRMQQDGYVIMYLDEIGAGYPTMAIIKALHNLRSNKNLHVITGCNPFNPVGQLDGELGRPHGGFESLKIDEDFVWNSANGSVTYRFDGLKSPNFDPDHYNEYPWLFNEERHQRLLNSTTRDSDFYNSQCRGFMNIGSGNRYVLTIPDIRTGAVDAPFEWSHEDKWKCAFLDPALSTDGDEAAYTLLEGGTSRGVDGALTPIIYASKQVIIPVFTGKLADNAFVDKCRKVRGATAEDNPHVGEEIPVERQIAINVAYQCLLDGVPFNMFGYDDSMRSKVMEAMIWAMGNAPMAVSSVGDPEDTPMYPPKYNVDPDGTRTLVTWKQDCSKFVSQVWFFGAAVVRSGFFRCSETVMPALNQATHRFWEFAAGGKKRFVESKKDMKLRTNGSSPDRADSLFGALYVAQKRGLLRLKIDLPSAGEHLTRAGRTHGAQPQRQTLIQRQWLQRRQKTGLHSTGTR